MKQSIITQRREALGLTVDELAFLCCVTPRTVKTWERSGVGNARLKHLLLLGHVLGVSLEDLLK